MSGRFFPFEASKFSGKYAKKKNQRAIKKTQAGLALGFKSTPKEEGGGDNLASRELSALQLMTDGSIVWKFMLQCKRWLGKKLEYLLKFMVVILQKLSI